MAGGNVLGINSSLGLPRLPQMGFGMRFFMLILGEEVAFENKLGGQETG